MRITFTPPSVTEASGGSDRFFSRVPIRRGVSVLKENGAYRQVRTPSQQECEAADIVYLGGHIYQIDEDERTALIEAGYGDLVEVVTEQYGVGLYGVGNYGS